MTTTATLAISPTSRPQNVSSSNVDPVRAADRQRRRPDLGAKNRLNPRNCVQSSGTGHPPPPGLRKPPSPRPLGAARPRLCNVKNRWSIPAAGEREAQSPTRRSGAFLCRVAP